MKRLDVRCCCSPTKVLGTMLVPDEMRSGDKFTVQLLEKIKLASAELRGEQPFETAVIKVLIFSRWDGPTLHTDLAVYGDGRSLGFWRRVPSFTE